MLSSVYFTYVQHAVLMRDKLLVTSKPAAGGKAKLSAS